MVLTQIFQLILAVLVVAKVDTLLVGVELVQQPKVTLVDLAVLAHRHLAEVAVQVPDCTSAKLELMSSTSSSPAALDS